MCVPETEREERSPDNWRASSERLRRVSRADVGKRVCASVCEGWERGDGEGDEGEKRGSEEARKREHTMNAERKEDARAARSADGCAKARWAR